MFINIPIDYHSIQIYGNMCKYALKVALLFFTQFYVYICFSVRVDKFYFDMTRKQVMKLRIIDLGHSQEI